MAESLAQQEVLAALGNAAGAVQRLAQQQFFLARLYMLKAT